MSSLWCICMPQEAVTPFGTGVFNPHDCCISQAQLQHPVLSLSTATLQVSCDSPNRQSRMATPHQSTLTIVLHSQRAQQQPDSLDDGWAAPDRCFQ